MQNLHRRFDWHYYIGQIKDLCNQRSLDKSTVEISQKFMAISEYMNFNQSEDSRLVKCERSMDCQNVVLLSYVRTSVLLKELRRSQLL